MEFDTFELTSNNYPVLRNNEKIVSRQNNVTILTNKQKFQRGIIYLTNLRLLWLKSNPTKNVTLAFNLEDVISKETSTNILSASTIKIDFRKSLKKDNNNINNNLGKSDVLLVDWECPICNQLNNGNDAVCVLCGVPKINEKEPTEEVETKIKKRRDTSSSKAINTSCISNKISGNNSLYGASNNDKISTLSYTSSTKVVDQITKPTVIKIECKACSYINEGDVNYCEICGSRLDSQKLHPEAKPIVCSICLFSNEPGSTVCSICAMPLKFCASSFDPNDNNIDNALLFSNDSSNINDNYYNSSQIVHYPSIIDVPSQLSVSAGFDARNPSSNLSYNNNSSYYSSIPPVPPKDNTPLSDYNNDDDDDDDDVSPVTSASPKISSQSSSLSNLKGESYRIKLLFKSGQTQFYNELCKTISEEHWKVISKENKMPKAQRVGVAGIIRNIQDNQKNTNEIMNQAFKDLNNLMKKASEMVAIAESISQKINQDNSMEGSKEQNQLKEILQELGISNPVTRRSTGGIYYQELAKQISKFIIKLFEKNGHVMTLPDIYCLYNRARGVELVSPEDLYKACNMFEKLNIPLKLRKFQSGLVIIEDSSKSDGEICNSIFNYIKNNNKSNTRGINSLELSKGLKIPIILVNEYLKIAEFSGTICRDETIEGIYYYENIFV
ncbi:Vps36-domain-containing protein [Neocallimastix californiae]|jgi:hypothetical protein|uniref:Vacuolar protein-sorting-associated protein 36 n=1 Tax=Neocallimastix californiae TaxID=1754190 RepID=A0A1Y2APW5_9FUNG|nr:Vps36-domain-containing protein [Neocallimastix californiae]|eukprot:ORY23975.1 Vps36-domain-containing protein [Neocallimastix californiae]